MKVTVNGEAHISHICEVQGSYLLEDNDHHCRFFLDITTRQWLKNPRSLPTRHLKFVIHRPCYPIFRYFISHYYFVLLTCIANIGLGIEEEASEVLHLEHSFMWWDASGSKVKVKAVCGSYSTAVLRNIVLLPKWVLSFISRGAGN